MLRRAASALWWRRYIARNCRPWGELDRFATLPPHEQRRELAARLHAQIQYFGSRADALPEWREAARIGDPQEIWKIWPSLPILTKDQLAASFPAAEIGRRFGVAGRVDSTGGSTGEPTRFFHDSGMIAANMALGVYTRLRLGWRPGMATIAVWGAERDIGRSVDRKTRLNNWLLRDYLTGGYKQADDTVHHVLRLIRAERPVAIYGFTSMLEFLARRVLDQGIHVRKGDVCCAWNGAEMLTQEQSDLFERVFGVPLMNRYGGREVSVIACQYERAGALQVTRPWLFVEIVDDQGRPAAPGEPGRILCTSTICRGTPFLRYEIGDLASFDAAGSGESGIFALSALQGRTGGLFELPDGRRIHAMYWNHLFKEFDEIAQFQVVIRTDNTLRILLVGKGMNGDREARLRSTIAHLLGDVKVDIEWVGRIPPTSQGKLLQVVRERAAAPN